MKTAMAIMIGLALSFGAAAQLSKNQFCDFGCNRSSCKAKAIQEACEADCSPDSVRNCLRATAVDDKKVLCSPQGCNEKSCQNAKVQRACREQCGANDVPRCLAAKAK